MKGVKLAFYLTKVSKGKGGNKQPIFSRMVRAEATGSTARKKVYLECLLDVSSEHVLQAFEPDTYLVKVGKESAMTKLLPEHVKEVCQFSVSKRRYLSFLMKNGGVPNL